MTELLFCCQQKVVNRDRRQDVALEMVRNSTAAKQSQVRPSVISFPPFHVRHPGDDHGTT